MKKCFDRGMVIRFFTCKNLDMSISETTAEVKKKKPLDQMTTVA